MEIELKLRLNPADALLLRHLPLLQQAAATRKRQKLYSIYFDTPQLDLLQMRMAIRVRRVAGKWIQTVKGGGSVLAGLHQRAEWEAPVKAARPELQHVPESVISQLDPDKWQQLQPVFETDFWRTTWQLEGPAGAVEVALDQGEVRSGDHSVALHEVELELKQGEPERLFQLARQLLQAVPLQLDSVSKAERGYRLYHAVAPVPVKAVSPRLNEQQDLAAGWLAILGECLRQWQKNESGYRDTTDNSEFLHQMRVALRRLRSALKLYRPFLRQPQVKPVLAELEWLMNQLGAARDWDVMLANTLPAAGVVPDATLQQAIIRHAGLAHQQVGEAIASGRAQLLLLQLGQWLLYPPLRKSAQMKSLPAFAHDVLVRQQSRLCREIVHAHKLTRTARHRLRVDAKRLRYALEFFAALYTVDEIRPFQKRLADLQEHLGAMNDIVVARELLGILQKSDSSLQLDTLYAVLKKREKHLLQALKPAGKAFAKMRPFWAVKGGKHV